MGGLPVLDGPEVVKVFQRHGWEVARGRGQETAGWLHGGATNDAGPM